MLTNISFTDPQGQSWTDAVLKVIDYGVHLNTSSRMEHDISDLANPVEHNNVSINASMQVAYWPNQSALDSGTAPYLLGNLAAKPASTLFSIVLDTAPAGLPDLELACEAYILSTILPPMQA